MRHGMRNTMKSSMKPSAFGKRSPANGARASSPSPNWRMRRATWNGCANTWPKSRHAMFLGRQGKPEPSPKSRRVLTSWKPSPKRFMTGRKAEAETRTDAPWAQRLLGHAQQKEAHLFQLTPSDCKRRKGHNHG